MDANSTLDTMTLPGGLAEISETIPLGMAHLNITDEVNQMLCNNSAIFNISRIDPIEYASVIYGQLMPILLVFTVVTNSLIIIVMNKPTMKSPTNLVLFWLAIADLLTLIAPSPFYFYMFTLGYHQVLLNGYFCHAYDLGVYYLPVIFHTASIWLTILLAGQRYVYICHPTLAKTWCTIPRVKRAIGSIFALSILAELYRLNLNTYIWIDCKSYSDEIESLLPACVRSSKEWVFPHIDYWYGSYYFFRIIFVNFLPCISLVILNFLLIQALQKAKANRKRLLNENNVGGGGSRRKRSEMSNSTTYMLIVLVTVFLAVEIPYAVVTVTHVLRNMNILTFSDETDYFYQRYSSIVIMLANFLVMCTFPTNFGIYFAMSAQFRSAIKEMLLRVMCKSSQLTEQPGTQETTISMGVIADTRLQVGHTNANGTHRMQ